MRGSSGSCRLFRDSDEGEVPLQAMAVSDTVGGTGSEDDDPDALPLLGCSGSGHFRRRVAPYSRDL
jgi:hypothetical protein